MIAWHDSNSKGIMAFAVPKKGEDEYAIRRATQDVCKILGYNKMIFKGDQEPALQAFMDTVSRLSGDQVIKEQSPVGESQSNGDIENAVQKIQGLFRTFRSNLETNYGCKVKPTTRDWYG